MKTLEELGISPAPWKCATDDYGEFVGTLNGRGFYVAKYAYDVKPQDARLIAASPKLYEAAYDVVTYCEKNHLVPSEQFKPVLARLRAAIAEAAGEEKR